MGLLQCVEDRLFDVCGTYILGLSLFSGVVSISEPGELIRKHLRFWILKAYKCGTSIYLESGEGFMVLYLLMEKLEEPPTSQFPSSSSLQDFAGARLLSNYSSVLLL